MSAFTSMKVLTRINDYSLHSEASIASDLDAGNRGRPAPSCAFTDTCTKLARIHQIALVFSTTDDCI